MKNEIKSESVLVQAGGTITVQVGRCLCLYGKPFVTLHKCDGVDPVTADDFTHLVAKSVNEAPSLLAERDRLRDAANKVEAALLPYRGLDMSPEKTYLVSRASVQQLRAVLAEGRKPKLKTAAALRCQDMEGAL